MPNRWKNWGGFVIDCHSKMRIAGTEGVSSLSKEDKDDPPSLPVAACAQVQTFSEASLITK